MESQTTERGAVSAATALAPEVTTAEDAPRGKSPIRHRAQTALLVVLLVLPLAGMVLVYRSQMTTLAFWIGIGLIGALGLAVYLARHARRMAFFEEFLLAEVFVLSLIGIGLTNLSPEKGLRFWLAMSVLIAVTALVMGAVRPGDRRLDGASFMATQLVHWAATLVTIAAVYGLFRSGRLTYDGTALVVLLVLGLSTFLDGYRLSWRFALIGVLITATSLMAAYMEQFTWPILLLAVFLLAIVVLIEGLRRKRARR